ncbi:TPA: hypothetical protein N0F65_002718 [Lagenidium giganteum]|uniref:Uncharacterized protein n=1 Tax=Lagenidium giganteum TaxID=4803 RepID=A0AAV2Z488_9STRA|nr:TPA: hypothetical protein N0F65_002718 [Lagenidium giganteum]
MSLTEQIARKTRKSCVLDEKSALMILAIPDYGDFKELQPYSCRSYSSRDKFVGGKDFITRHNPQEVSEFKKQYSREVGNLNRHHSVVAPPMNALGSSVSSESLAAVRELVAGGSPSRQNSNTLVAMPDSVWKKTFAAGGKACWILTDHGIHQLIGPEFKITTRVPLLPTKEMTSPMPRLPAVSRTTGAGPTARAETPASPFTSRQSAMKGLRVDLSNEKLLGSLSRLAVYQQSPSATSAREQSPTKSRMCTASTHSPSRPSTSAASGTTMGWTTAFSTMPWSPYLSLSSSRDEPPALATAVKQPVPTITPFAMEVSPPSVQFGQLKVGQVYMFPIRVRNVGVKQERFRVGNVAIACGGIEAQIAQAHYEKDQARLAAGLAAIVTLTVSFQRAGTIHGKVRIDTESAGGCDVRIDGHVRVS